MHPKNSYGPDGMTLLYYQRSWKDDIEKDLAKMVNKFYPINERMNG